ncbi:MAG TPA: hypothetical protein VGL72_09715 [Bryobacteraceae bacterium]|jgi:hypothetical protein
MDPATIALSVMTILGPYVSQVGEALTKTVGEVAVDKASKLLGWLKKKFEGDPAATKDLTRFEKDPKSYEVALKSTIQEKAEADPGFAQEAETRIAEIGPTITVFQDIAEGRLIIGAEGDVKAGRVSVNQKVQKADEITGVKGNIG